MLRLLTALALVSMLPACGSQMSAAEEKASPAGRGPVETDPPNGRGQQPAFPGQTRAPQPADLTDVNFEEFATGFGQGWGLAPLPDGRFLVTAKEGELRVVTRDGRVLGPIDGVPRVENRGQGGLLDVAVNPTPDGAFLVCLSYAEPREGGLSGTAVSCGRASGAENIALEPMRVVFRQEPPWRSAGHFGSRLAFAPDGTLFVTTGDRQREESRVNAQKTDNTIGKVVRINLDGSAPRDNPFAAQGGAGALVWSLGHRNLQAAAIRPSTGKLWTVEHGPAGGDELNKPEAGKNYGWPIITYGLDYNGRPIGDGITAKAGLEQPIYYWDPVIAPSGMIFHSGKLFSGWRDNILIGGLRSRSVTRLVMDGDRVAAEQRISVNGGVRDLAEGVDGAVYLIVEADASRIVKMTPKP